MSRIFGPVRQNGYIVRDIDAAMKHWVEVMGVGPWYYIDRVQTDWFRHRGVDSAVEMSIALANSGDSCPLDWWVSDVSFSDLFFSVFSAFQRDKRACPRAISALMPKSAPKRSLFRLFNSDIGHPAGQPRRRRRAVAAPGALARRGGCPMPHFQTRFPPF